MSVALSKKYVLSSFPRQILTLTGILVIRHPNLAIQSPVRR